MSDENEPVSAEAVQKAHEMANELLEIVTRKREINSEKERELFLSQQISSSLNDQLDAIYEAQAGRKRIVEELEEEKQAILDNAALNKESQEQVDKQIAALDKQIAKTNKLAGTHKDVVAEMERERDLHEENAALIEDSTDASERAKKMVQEGVQAATGFGDAWKGSVLGANLLNAKVNGIGSALKDVGAGMKAAFSPMNIAGSILTGIVQQTIMLAKATDDARASFAGATGQGSAYNSEISAIRSSTTMYGVDADEAQQALRGLMNSMAGFNNLGATARRELGDMAAIMGEIGVSAEEAGKIFTVGTKSLGFSVTETKQMTANLHGLSKVLGKDFSAVAGDFNAVMGDLAVYGKDAPKVFAKLAGAASELGISVDSLVGSMMELDTIEGAAARAGQVNAALGGQFLDTHELLNASLDERVVMMKEALDASGKDLATMSRAEKQMVATAAGFKDVGELAAYMNTDIGTLTSTMEEAGAASGSIEEMGSAAKASMKMSDLWAKALEGLAVAIEPLIDYVREFLIWLGPVLAMPAAKWVLAAGAAFYFLRGAVAPTITALDTGFKVIGKGAGAMSGMVKEAGGMSQVFKNVGASAKSAFGGMKATLLSVGASAKQGFGKMVTAAKDLPGMLSRAATGMKEWGGSVLSSVKAQGGWGAAAKNVWGVMKGGLGTIWQSIKGIWAKIAGMAAESTASTINASTTELETQAKERNADATDAQADASKNAGKFGEGFITFLKSLLATIKGNIPQLLALGLTFMMIGAAIFIAAYGVAELVRSFAGFSAGEILAIAVALAVFGATMVGLVYVLYLAVMSGALPAAAGGLMAFGVAAIMVAIAVVILAAAFMIFVKALLMLVPYGVELLIVAAALYLLAGASILMLPAGIMALIGLGLLALGLGLLATALFFIKTDDLVALAGIFNGLAAVAGLAGDGLAKAAPVVRDLLDVLSDVVDDITAETLAKFVGLGLAFIALGFGAGMAMWTLPDLVPVLQAIGAGIIVWHGAMMLLEQIFPRVLSQLPPFESFLQSIVDLTDAAVDRLFNLAEAIYDLADALSEMNIPRTIHFTTMIRDIAEEGPKITPAVISNVQGLVDAADSYSEIHWGFYGGLFGGLMDPFTDMLKSATATSPAPAAASSGGGGGTATGGGPTIVTLELDGKELGRTVEKLLSKRNKLKTIS
jgi:hypothetical protein